MIDTRLTLSKTRGRGVSITTSPENYSRLERATLPGCPFYDYYALDLLRDLITMFSWRMEFCRSYDISEFLTLCNDAHAEAYRHIIAA